MGNWAADHIPHLVGGGILSGGGFYFALKNIWFGYRMLQEKEVLR